MVTLCFLSSMVPLLLHTKLPRTIKPRVCAPFSADLTFEQAFSVTFRWESIFSRYLGRGSPVTHIMLHACHTQPKGGVFQASNCFFSLSGNLFGVSRADTSCFTPSQASNCCSRIWRASSKASWHLRMAGVNRQRVSCLNCSKPWAS